MCFCLFGSAAVPTFDRSTWVGALSVWQRHSIRQIYKYQLIGIAAEGYYIYVCKRFFIIKFKLFQNEKVTVDVHSHTCLYYSIFMFER